MINKNQGDQASFKSQNHSIKSWGLANYNFKTLTSLIEVVKPYNSLEDELIS
jgi:hypothetical protein